MAGSLTLRNIHDFELALLDPAIAMTTRGVLLNEPRRQAMMKALGDARVPLLRETRDFVVSEIFASALAGDKPLPNKKLFLTKWRCRCCRAGKIKTQHCWTCADYKERPGLRILYNLPKCRQCGGEPKRDDLTFKPTSTQQVKIVLYNLLKLPKRIKDGKLTADEDALKSLLAHDSSGFVKKLIEIRKLSTMRSIFKRIEPGADGRIRSFYNPAGTETGRFSSSGGRPESKVNWALVESTNLQNMPKKEAKVDARFNVRHCFVPEPGHVFIEADLGGAEAWVTAACSGDDRLLQRLADPNFNVHIWTATAIFPSKSTISRDSDEYTLGKKARHALNYGMQWATFLKNINADADKTGIAIDAADARRITRAYHKLHPELKQWWNQVQRRLNATKNLTTCFGRKRTFFGRGQGVWLGEAHREAIAFEPQSTVADLLNRGLLRWWRQHDGKIGDLLMQVHDSVLISVPRERAALAAQLLRRCLEEEIEVNGRSFTIPVEVSTSATSWAEMRAA